MTEREPRCPLFRVTTFGTFSLQRLICDSPSSHHEPHYEPFAEKTFQRRSAAGNLLKLLLLSGHRRASKDVLMEALWPHAELSSASHSFDTAIWVLREILRPQGAKSLLIKSHTNATTFYALPPQHILETDVETFLALYAQADHAEIWDRTHFPF